MAFSPIELVIYKGFVNSNTFGLPASTFVQPVQEAIDLLNGTYTVHDEQGVSSFSPTIPVIKDGGIWVDSPTIDGRQLMAAKRGNVLDVITLRAGQTEDLRQRAKAIVRLDLFGDAAKDFWVNNMGGPVYMQYRPPDATGPQFALIYTIDVEIDEDGLSSDGPGIITITIEREPAWRGIAPGVSPKVWTMLERGVKPTTTEPPPAGYFNYTKLSLTSTNPAAEHKHLIDRLFTANVNFRVDEIGTSNVNYIDIPADKLYGDAPCLLYLYAGTTHAPTTMYFARSTRPDFFPSINTNAVNQRMRNTWNGGDSTLVGGGGLTSSKVVDAAAGLLSNGSTVTRYLLRGAGVAGGYVETSWATWTRSANHYNRKWMVFARIRVSTGTPASHFLRVTMKVLGTTVTTVTRQLDTAAAALKLIYIGELDGSRLNNRDNSGVGWATSFGTTVTALLTKTNDGVASNVDLADLVFLPVDEPTIKLANLINSVGMIDTTGYYGFDSAPIGMTNGGFDRAEAIGQAIYLVPNVTNRIYYLDDFCGTNWFVGNGIQIFGDIVPRWYGIRDM